jgi:transposase
MTRLLFSSAECAELRAVARHAPAARHARRALALLDLARGEAVTAVADRHGVSRMAVHLWVARFRAGGSSAWDRLKDRPRSGRPSRRPAVLAAVRRALATSPLAHGYRHPSWTVPLRARHLARAGLAVSRATVRRALRDGRYAWKRPRRRLSRRPPTRRQAKGG